MLNTQPRLVPPDLPRIFCIQHSTTTNHVSERRFSFIDRRPVHMSTCSLQHGASLAARHPRGYSTISTATQASQPRVSSREPRITSGTSQYFRQVKTPRSSMRAERPPQTPQRTPITTRVPRRSTVWGGQDARNCPGWRLRSNFLAGG